MVPKCFSLGSTRGSITLPTNVNTQPCMHVTVLCVYVLHALVCSCMSQLSIPVQGLVIVFLEDDFHLKLTPKYLPNPNGNPLWCYSQSDCDETCGWASACWRWSEVKVSDFQLARWLNDCQQKTNKRPTLTNFTGSMSMRQRTGEVMIEHIVNKWGI